jgi:arsenate reductase
MTKTVKNAEPRQQFRQLRTEDPPVILYLCKHNAGRSQMAAAFTAHLGQDRVSVMSAGSTPAREVNPVAVQIMGELGIDLSGKFPTPITHEVVRAADVVITMGCGDACPFYPGKRYLDWEVADPAGQHLEVVRAIRDDIRHRVENLLTELGVLDGARGEDSQRHGQHVDSAYPSVVLPTYPHWQPASFFRFLRLYK